MFAQILKTGLLSIGIIFSLSGYTQLIDNISTFKSVNNKSYFRFHYDNDYFTKTDYYYSQGVTVEYVHTGLKKFPVSKLLLKPGNSDTKYGITFNLFGYTPTSISKSQILYGDRPYSSAMSIKFFAMGSDSIRQQRLASSLSIGILGPAAQGQQIQTGIHRWLKNRLPQGWQHQIKNDILLNYQVNYEKKLFNTGNDFLLNATAEARIGTVHDRVSGGINFMTGHFNDRYISKQKRKKVEYYFFGQSRLNIIAYDATMQGGLFNKKSIYTISSGDVERLTFQADGGVVFNFRKLFLTYTQSFITKEFRTGKYHRWGGISFGFSF
ncbi:MAG: lipid A deacylase LpxR family protein [Chitinophagaceae bacterium]